MNEDERDTICEKTNGVPAVAAQVTCYACIGICMTEILRFILIYSIRLFNTLSHCAGSIGAIRKFTARCSSN